MSQNTSHLLRTPLYECHRSSHARMANVGGWEMPVAFGSQIQEHHTVRQDAAMFDFSHACVVDLHGAEVRAFLGKLLANDVARLKSAGKAMYSCMLNGDGGVIDDLVVYYLADDHFRIVLNAHTARGDLEWIRSQIAGTDSVVTVVARRPDLVTEGVEPLATIAVHGPNARESVFRAIPSTQVAAQVKPFNSIIVHDPVVGELMLARTGKTSEDGFELIVLARHAVQVWDMLRSAGIVPAGLDAWETLRLEAGMQLAGRDMDPRCSPFDVGLGWSVDLDSERDFVGKAALRTRRQTRQFVGLVFEQSAAVARTASPVVNLQGEVIGTVTSGTYSPTLQIAIALALIDPDIPFGAYVDVEVYRNRVAAKVVRPPFVRDGRSMPRLA
ncbi:glycine cleavage system aminomethyltransferase GcvT [Cupriavidus consociatus]|uniref:glycine cleavage system aminomethyltransferase GcvT n=1 Tax=Cupriavidus consociatus TaxID=2821357 RepID=UPI001AE9E8A6|nr:MULTISPECIES: glycine cleavage system aminomethyltransferase GcvT [unclassified Cupriavidus]MBP0618920.1 glycine cleavage system aminomethyltransferase GcvT [Cupriavidus sp. LEh25]MDK2655563.1 glycine cleavage system aminomethyltransferase GcvT [Cupriavidus sp. LEh21]